jgi:hypothetical protein
VRGVDESERTVPWKANARTRAEVPVRALQCTKCHICFMNGNPGDPARMAARIIESVDVEPAPLRMVLGSQALESTLSTLRKRIANFEAQTELAASTDFPPGE